MAGKTITEIRILPPLAIGRLGSSPIAMDNYDFDGFIPAEDDPDDAATGYRRLISAPTLNVDRRSGQITMQFTPEGPPQFRDGNGLIRPICPFLEVWAIFDGDGPLQPLTKHHLEDLGLDASAIVWNVEAVNSKAYRRTDDPDDRICAETGDFSNHDVHDFVGQSANFRKGKSIHLGDVQYLVPTDEFPEIRLRFTPAPGKVYGPVKDPDTGSVDDVYDPDKGQWPEYYDNKPGTQYPTQPGSIFWGRSENVETIVNGTKQLTSEWVSYGYLDDMCDGVVRVSLKGTELSTFSRISVGPPDFAPDSLPVRAVSDELKQIADGPEVSGPVTQAQAEDIVRRALETVRLMYTVAMNGNPIMIDGKNHNTNNMAVQNFRDTGGQTTKANENAPIEPVPGTGRAWSSIFNPPDGQGITNIEVTQAHRKLLQQILKDKPLPKYVTSLLRDYQEVGNYYDGVRRKMPGLMRNADGMLMALTRHMVSLVDAATNPYAPPPPTPPSFTIDPRNRTAQFEHRSAGNSPGTLLTTAVSNNFPGLEFDYRSIWRHVFIGVQMYEAGPRVIKVDSGSAAEKAGVKPQMLMLDVDGESLWADVSGPIDESKPTEITPFPTQGLEWSNAIATIVQKAQHNAGATVTCRFVTEPVADYTREQLFAQPISVELEVRPMFAPELGEGNAVFGLEIAGAGELTQGLCSPWQNDYRECSCYYWAAARPDFVNRTSDGNEITGDNWLQRNFDGHYEVDDRTSESQLKKFVSYKELFRSWEEVLQFVIAGQTEEKS